MILFYFLLQATALGPVEDRNVLIERARLAFKAMIPTHTFVFNNESKTMDSYGLMTNHILSLLIEIYF